MLVNDYYDLVTDFYEFGWGQSFHFAPRRRGESFKESLFRHQHFLADQLSLKPGMQVLDVGCGVGGPMGNFTRWSGASFAGVNINLTLTVSIFPGTKPLFPCFLGGFFLAFLCSVQSCFLIVFFVSL